VSDGHLEAWKLIVDTADQAEADQQHLQWRCLAQVVHLIFDAACNRELCGCCTGSNA